MRPSSFSLGQRVLLGIARCCALALLASGFLTAQTTPHEEQHPAGRIVEPSEVEVRPVGTSKIEQEAARPQVVSSSTKWGIENRAKRSFRETDKITGSPTRPETQRREKLGTIGTMLNGTARTGRKTIVPRVEALPQTTALNPVQPPKERALSSKRSHSRSKAQTARPRFVRTPDGMWILNPEFQGQGKKNADAASESRLRATAQGRRTKKSSVAGTNLDK